MQVIALAFGRAGMQTLQILAVVLVILTRPRPRPLLWAFWVSATAFNCAIGFVILAIFSAKGSVLGSTSDESNPALYIVTGIIALCIAAFASTHRGRQLIGARAQARSERKREAADPDTLRGRAKGRLQSVSTRAGESLKAGSVWVTVALGLILGLPDPLQLAAVGLIVRDQDPAARILLVVVFSVITYIVALIPLVSYTFWPAATSGLVARLAEWLGARKLQVLAAVVAALGIVLLIRGIAAI